ncbi:MAG: hypothetical protein ABI266_00785, partial [Ginsengibacter sp.]
MIKIIINITCILSFLMMADCSAQIIPKISMKDFGTLSGSWQGSLTYLDYSSGKPFTMPADITVRRIKKSNKFIFSNIYPNEPNANSIDTM